MNDCEAGKTGASGDIMQRVSMKRQVKKTTKKLQTEIIVGTEELNLYRDFWLSLAPRERLRRSMALRKRLRNPASIHDEKLFPKP